MKATAYILAGVFAVLIVIFLLKKNEDCQERGGVLVRGVFSYECITAKRVKT